MSPRLVALSFPMKLLLVLPTLFCCAASLSPAQVFDGPGNASPAAPGTTSPGGSAPGAPAKPVVGQELPMMNPGSRRWG